MTLVIQGNWRKRNLMPVWKPLTISDLDTEKRLPFI